MVINLMAEYRKLVATANDTSRSATAQLGATTKAEKLSQEYRVRLKSKMAKYNPDALPDDLPTRRSKLIELVEAARHEPPTASEGRSDATRG